jgi:hypothetical protein
MPTSSPCRRLVQYVRKTQGLFLISFQDRMNWVVIMRVSAGHGNLITGVWSAVEAAMIKAASVSGGSM